MTKANQIRLYYLTAGVVAIAAVIMLITSTFSLGWLLFSIFIIPFLALVSHLTEKKIKDTHSSLDGIHLNGLDDTYLFDFKNYSSQYNDDGIGTFAIRSIDDDEPPTAHKIKIKPIDVLNELEGVPLPFGLSMIDEKISVLRDKAKLITQKYAKREVDALIERMENRKKYNLHKAFFESFQNTNDEKIGQLLEKYDLVMKTSDIFVPEFPDQAIERMKSYAEKMHEICGKKPVFYVIAEPDKFRKAYEKRDPILLVQSPFGFYWQILGAWDKEMLLLSEL